MKIKKWSKEHQIVFAAFKKHLPAGEALQKLSRDLNHGRDNEKNKYAAYNQYLKAVVMDLGNDAGGLLLNYLVKPAEHHLPIRRDDTESIVNEVACVLAAVYYEQHPSQDSAVALIDRLKMMFDDPLGACEIESSWIYGENDFINRYFFPKANDCLKMLSKHSELETVKCFLYAVYEGQFNVQIEHKEDDCIQSENTCNSFIGSEYEIFNDFVQVLFKDNRLTYEWFRKAVKLYPGFVQAYRVFPDEESEGDEENEGVDSAFLDTYRDFVIRLIKEEITRLPQSASYLNDIISYETLKGIEWMRLGMDSIDRLELKAKNLKDEYEDLAGVIRRLICISGLQAGETDKDLIGMLSHFKASVLLLALPYAGYARNAILEALGWKDLLPLQQQLFQIAGGCPATTESLDDVYNCENPESGVIDRAAVAEALEAVDKKRLTQYRKALQVSSLEIKNSLMLVAAVMGVDREKIEKKLVRHGQAAIKAYGLYPMESEEELRERYLTLKAMHKEATQYGPERQANTQAAVKAGLKNLAQAAGYTDEIRLEWAMEADIADSLIPLDQSFEADAWSVELTLEGITPRIQVSKDGKILKSVPPKVRKTDIYARMRDTQDIIKSQASRFRKTLEDMMCCSDIITADQLVNLNRLPIVRAMLAQLILQTDNGGFGVFDGSSGELTGLQEESVAINDHVSITHVYHLFQAGVLSDWQKAIVRKRMVQPFKQAFRELYVVTPAELETNTSSRRFVGHVIDSAVASRLLQSRGWTQMSDDIVEVYKRFPRHKIQAVIDFPDARHYLAEDSEVTIDEIWFEHQGEKIPLENIEPIVFSEVMRDVDLITSVAQVDEKDIRWSTETAQRRAELIVTLVEEIGLKQVRCEGHFAYIQGKLANYKIHLGSAVIHIQPGNYLCIVPERKKEDHFYLPFADTDLRMAEILSKIFLLVSDDKITDKTILSQIKDGTAG